MAEMNERDRLIQAHHDGQADADQAARLQPMLDDPQVQRELAVLAELSAAFAAAPRPLAPATLATRAHAAVDRMTNERALLRFGRWATAAAAAILISASLGLTVSGQQSNGSDDDPISQALLALNPGAGDAADADDPNAAVASWIVDSLDESSGANGQEPQP